MHLARIVIGVDLTKISIQAAAWAAQIFAPEADVVLLHCLSPLLPERKLACERQHAAGYLSYLAARIGTTRCTYRIEVGNPARCLADLAAQVDADLIAVGEHEDHPDR
jgi:nucleotide-binding universal stress UspA family protein